MVSNVLLILYSSLEFNDISKRCIDFKWTALNVYMNSWKFEKLKEILFHSPNVFCISQGKYGQNNHLILKYYISIPSKGKIMYAIKYQGSEIYHTFW